MTTPNLWEAAKAVLRGKFIVITILPQETRKKHRADNLTLHLKRLEKKNQKNKNKTTTTTKNKISRRKEIIQIRVEINEKEMKETTVKINKTKS